jgi:ABC-type glycerol-3-phosphate transport system permease component
MTSRRRIVRLLIGFVVLLAVIAALFPVAFGGISAFSPDGRDLNLDPGQWVMRNYQAVFGLPEFWNALMNSVIVSVGTVIIAVIVSVPAAYVLTRATFRTERVALVFLAARMVPGLVLVIPLYLLYQNIGLRESQLGLIGSYLTFSIPFAVWMIYGLFAEIPLDVDDAAAIDGAGHISIMWRILVPISAGGLWSVIVLLFVFCWNEFLFALVLTTQDTQTFVPLLTRWVLPQGPQYGQIFAGATIFLIPPMVALLLIRNRLTEAFSLGGIH